MTDMTTMNTMADVTLMIERLDSSSVQMTTAEKAKYIKAPDDLGVIADPEEGDIPLGYKRCGRCNHVKKFYLFNKNSASKNNVTGNCKECQKSTSTKSYTKTKKKRSYKKYYNENKERKQEAARKYYADNKDKINEKHKAYLSTSKGKKVMRLAHKKRRSAMKLNAGIPYSREVVIDRDSSFLGMDKPICWICQKPIEDISGNSLHLDHVVSIVNGGADCFANIACTHKECNLTKEKDDRNLDKAVVDELRMRSEAYMEAFPEIFEDSVK